MAESGDSGKTKVNVGYPYDEFHHGVKGVESLVRGRSPEEAEENAVAVSDSELKKLREAADKAGIPLEEF